MGSEGGLGGGAASGTATSTAAAAAAATTTTTTTTTTSTTTTTTITTTTTTTTSTTTATNNNKNNDNKDIANHVNGTSNETVCHSLITTVSFHCKLLSNRKCEVIPRSIANISDSYCLNRKEDYVVR